MKRCVVAGLALMGLMGCLTTPEAPAPTLPVFRAMSAPIASQTDVTLYLMEPVGPGRWKTQSPSGTLPDEDLWVMWMDFDSRTAAIGNPSGEFGWIMDKNPTGGGDRITAARDIMEWFGWALKNAARAVGSLSATPEARWLPATQGCAANLSPLANLTTPAAPCRKQPPLRGKQTLTAL